MAASRQRAGRLPSAAGRETEAVLLFLREIRVALLLINAARYRALQRWLGLDKTGANLLTLVAVAAMADAAQRQTTRLVAPGAPAAADFALSAAVAESALRTLAGQTASGAAPGSLLLTIAIVYKLVGVPGRRALREAARSPLRLRKAVMAQAERLGEAAAAAAASARDAASAAAPTTDPTTTPL
ncbi:MAG: hypothetical protein ACXVFO_15175 [Solirubrobacteraceae bacterium]